jgi:hypothetical protein
VMVAFTVTVFGFGNVPGGRYSPFALIVPTVELPPDIPLTVQVNAAFMSPVTVAENCCGSPTRTLAVAGVIVTAGPDSPTHPVAAMQIAARNTMAAGGRCSIEFPIEMPP